MLRTRTADSNFRFPVNMKCYVVTFGKASACHVILHKLKMVQPMKCSRNRGNVVIAVS